MRRITTIFLSMLLALTLLSSSCYADGNSIFPGLDLDGLMQDFGIDSDTVDEVIGGVTDFVGSILGKGFSDNPSAMETATKSVLLLYGCDKSGNAICTGSGFIMYDGQTVVTNYHVIDGVASVIAETDSGRQYRITKMLTGNKNVDVAFLHLEQNPGLVILTASTTQPRRGDKCVAIGSPRGLKNSVSIGNVSAFRSEDGNDYIQFTAPISSGNSGGALFNDNGEVIGIPTFVLDYKDSGVNQNLNFALMIKDVNAVYKRWNGKYTVLPGAN